MPTSACQWWFRCCSRGCVPLWAASGQPVGQQVWNQRPGWSRWSHVPWITKEVSTALLVNTTVFILRQSFKKTSISFIDWIICKNKQRTWFHQNIFGVNPNPFIQIHFVAHISVNPHLITL